MTTEQTPPGATMIGANFENLEPPNREKWHSQNAMFYLRFDFPKKISGEGGVATSLQHLIYCYKKELV